MHRALSDCWSFLAECDIQGYQGDIREKVVHKKLQIKDCSLCPVSPVLHWNGRNVAGRPAGPRSLLPLLNLKRPFFIQNRTLANQAWAMHSGDE